MNEHERSFPECHYHTLTLQKRVEAMAVEEVIAYPDFTALIGEDVRAVMHLLSSARHRARVSAGIVTAAIPGVGIQRLSDPGILGLASGRTKHIGRTSLRALRELGHVEFAALSDDDKKRHNMFASMHGVVRQLSRPATMKKLEGAVSMERQPLALGAYFAAIRGQV